MGVEYLQPKSAVSRLHSHLQVCCATVLQRMHPACQVKCLVPEMPKGHGSGKPTRVSTVYPRTIEIQGFVLNARQQTSSISIMNCRCEIKELSEASLYVHVCTLRVVMCDIFFSSLMMDDANGVLGMRQNF